MGKYSVGTRINKSYTLSTKNGKRRKNNSSTITCEGMITSIRPIVNSSDGFDINAFDYKFSQRNDVLYTVTYDLSAFSDKKIQSFKVLEDEEIDDDQIESLPYIQITLAIYNTHFSSLTPSIPGSSIRSTSTKTSSTSMMIKPKKAKYKVGTKIKKKFDKRVYKGIIASISFPPSSSSSICNGETENDVWYNIIYHDGDCEDMNEEQIDQCALFPINDNITHVLILGLTKDIAKQNNDVNCQDDIKTNNNNNRDESEKIMCEENLNVEYINKSNRESTETANSTNNTDTDNSNNIVYDNCINQNFIDDGNFDINVDMFCTDDIAIDLKNNFKNTSQDNLMITETMAMAGVTTDGSNLGVLENGTNEASRLFL